jgi:hypothetical protein
MERKCHLILFFCLTFQLLDDKFESIRRFKMKKPPLQPWLVNLIKNASQIEQNARIISNLSHKTHPGLEQIIQHNIQHKITIKNKVYGIIDNELVIDGRGIISRDRHHNKYDHLGCDPLALAIKRNGEVCFIKNADQDFQPRCLDKYPTISFNCLGRFFADDYFTTNAIFALMGGKILDFTLDACLPLKSGIKQKIKNKTVILPPEPGYVRVDNKWHRSGSFLICYQQQTILLGVDENTYFGCELVDTPTTIPDAYTSLMPKEIRHLNCPRQGEWYAVATDPINEYSADVLATADSCYLPVENADSNYHQVIGETFFTRQGLIVRNPDVEHDDHRTLNLRGWYRFVKNTAKRSMSEQGAD